MDTSDKGPMLLGVVWTFQVFAFALVGLRLYARLRVVQTYGWDDHFFNASVVCAGSPKGRWPPSLTMY